ncbi:atp-dependent dna helicase pif1 [Moniliophthora roreri MCA 2997]|uniref:Atp-dependent dna helicase pif1 n=1 Tax=Moniliophthora roreri (strain MCA 2997) TaxID=1381753 RepID=V2XRH2_MONRO|nr:atp-dependent dna helicase pif1 [Moniliophthora roreri MCA 2997]
MQAPVEPDDSIVDDYDGPSPDVASIISAGRDHGFYNSGTSSADFHATFLNRSTIATDEDWQAADAALNFLLKQQEVLLKARQSTSAQNRPQNQHYYMQNNIVPLPFSTNINAEIEKAKLHYAQDNHMDSHSWNELSDWQQLAIALINKYGLNEQQKLAFLLLADAVIKQYPTYQNSLLAPFRMLVTGPGAPTGIVASDISGSTIHSEAALRVKRQNMKADTPGGKKVQAELEQHIGLLRTLVVDEIYFMEPSDITIDAHNSECARAFAEASGQAFQVYHSVDARRVQGRRQELKEAAAEAAWQVPVKRAKDLGRKVPLILGMLVFGTENLAPELGISKGSQSTLVSVKYEERDGHYYAVSATVDFPAYIGNSDRKCPHCIILKPISQFFKFKLPNYNREYSATRNQIPLIPAFACTSHNAQGCSMDVVCIDLASCRSIQSAYVMLSRVHSLKGLCILCPFGLNRIKNHISEELCCELKRTCELSFRTEEYVRKQLDWYYSRF